MSKVFDEKENSIEKVTEENVEKVEVREAEVVAKEEVKEEVKEEEKKESLSFLEKILQVLTKYLGCSNKRADVLISANKPVEMETNKNDDAAAI